MTQSDTSYCAYETEVAQDAPESPQVRSLWETMVASRDTTAAAYQSPAFFEYLRDTELDSQFEVLTVRETQGDRIVGIVPVKLSAFPLVFSAGARALIRLPMRGVNILGGELMVPKCFEAFDSVFKALSDRYRGSGLLYLAEVSVDSDLWRYLQTSKTIQGLFDLYVLDGFRECHSIPMPATLDEYYRKLNKKRRYNLLRQEKILRKYSQGKLDLVTVDSQGTLPDLFEAIDRLAAPHKKENISNRDQYVLSAERGFLKCFVLKSASVPIAVVIGTRAGRVYRVHQFLHDPALAKYSPGTTLWQLVLKELIITAEFTVVDMGYGTPAYPHRATNVIEYKGRILLFRRSLANRSRVLAHRSYSGVVNFIKRRIGREAERP